MYTVHCYDEFTADEMVVFEGSLAECLAVVADDEFDELYIVEPDGFTVY